MEISFRNIIVMLHSIHMPRTCSLTQDIVAFFLKDLNSSYSTILRKMMGVVMIRNIVDMKKGNCNNHKDRAALGCTCWVVQSRLEQEGNVMMLLACVKIICWAVQAFPWVLSTHLNIHLFFSETLLPLCIENPGRYHPSQYNW